MAACFAVGRHKNYDISLELQIETINFSFNACDYIFIVCYDDDDGGKQTEKSVLAAENDSKDMVILSANMAKKIYLLVIRTREGDAFT